VIVSYFYYSLNNKLNHKNSEEKIEQTFRKTNVFFCFVFKEGFKYSRVGARAARVAGAASKLLPRAGAEAA
jgi:hypothetical protein